MESRVQRRVQRGEKAGGGGWGGRGRQYRGCGLNSTASDKKEGCEILDPREVGASGELWAEEGLDSGAHGRPLVAALGKADWEWVPPAGQGAMLVQVGNT